MNEEILIDETFLRNYWNSELKKIGNEEYFHQYVDGFKMLVSEDAADNNLHLNTMGWKISVKKHMLKSLLTAPAIAAALQYLGYHDLPAYVLPSIIPMLFEIENIELDRKEEEIWISLPVKKFKNQFKSAEEWYESLPDKIKSDINLLDFKNFMQKLVFAGLGKQNPNDKFIVLKKGEGIFKISIS